MKAEIEIRMDNAAFEQAPGTELCRILRKLADKIEREAPDECRLMDSNGNTVGHFTLEDD